MKGRETDEWLKQNHRSTRNFIRKWGHFVKHDALMKPIVPSKYDVGFVIHNCNYETLYELEPWCSSIYVDSPVINGYIEEEQPNTLIDLRERVNSKMNEATNDIVVEFSAREFTPEQMNYIAQLPEILANSAEEGTMELGIFTFTINKLKTYEKELIECER